MPKDKTEVEDKDLVKIKTRIVRLHCIFMLQDKTGIIVLQN